MIACLPMYDWAEMRPATDRFWALIRDRLRARGIDAPDTLHRGERWDDWRAPDLLLSQTCGYPYRTALHGHVALVGTPDYGLPDAPPGHYYSQLIVRHGEGSDWRDYLGGVLAINGHDSQSGWAAPQNHAAPEGLSFTRQLVTGAHVASAAAVAEGQADIAAIDAVTWRLLARYRSDLAQELTVIARTAPTPGLPLISAPSNDSAALAAVVSAAIAALTEDDRQALGLRGLVHIPAERYLAVRTPPPPGV